MPCSYSLPKIELSTTELVDELLAIERDGATVGPNWWFLERQAADLLREMAPRRTRP